MSIYTEERDPNVVADERRVARKLKKENPPRLAVVAAEQAAYVAATNARHRAEVAFRALPLIARPDRLALYATIQDEEYARAAYHAAYYKPNGYWPE